MNITSTTSATPITSTYTSPTSSTGVQDASQTPCDRTEKSKLGDLMTQLQDLESSDPDKAKAVLSKIATGLRDKADATNDPKMKALADKFNQAAQSGDLSALRPPAAGQGAQAGGHHHGHHGGGHHHAATTQGKVDTYQQNGNDPTADVESIISSALAS